MRLALSLRTLVVFGLGSMLAGAVAQAGTRLDKKFGAGGVVTTAFGDFARASAVAVQADGKIVAAGFSASAVMSGYDYDFALARYNPDGSLDADFGTGGKVTTDFGTSADLAMALAIQPSDGKIVVAGYSNLVMAVARYDTHGDLDPDFGTGGKTTLLIDSNCQAKAIAIQPADGKIVLAGNAFTGSGNNFALARLGTDGTPDSQFGSSGKVSVHFTTLPVEFGNALVLQEDGQIVVAGQAYSNLNGALNDLLVARYDDGGTPDGSFGAGGYRQIDINPDEEAANAVALQRDGKILAAGFTFQNNTGDFALARLDGSGDLDPSFGTGGVQTTDFAAGPGNGDTAYAVSIQPGKTPDRDQIVLAGTAFIGPNYDFALARYTLGGVLEKSFGKKGKLSTAIGPGDRGDGIFAVARQADGMLVAAGGSGPGQSSSNEFVLVRYKTK